MDRFKDGIKRKKAAHLLFEQLLGLFAHGQILYELPVQVHTYAVVVVERVELQESSTKQYAEQSVT